MSEASCHAAVPNACAPAARPRTTRDGWPAWRDIAAVGAVLDRLARSWRRCVAIRDLHRLNDRELRDLGIERGQIEDVVDEMMARSPTP